MKILRALAFLPLFLIGSLAKAQTETVAPKAKKLKQLYLSVGTGPALTTNKDSRPLGGTSLLNLSGSFGPGSIFRLNFQHSGFMSPEAPAPGMFSYLQANNYNSTFFTSNKSTTISFSYGMKKQVNKLAQLQALAGLGFNRILFWPYDPTGTACDCSGELLYKPGVLLQAEAMFLPTKFAGLTAGVYTNLTTKLPSAGINLSLNLGMLK